MSANGVTFVVHGTQGDINCDPDTGEVLSRESPDTYPDITRFNIKGYRDYLRAGGTGCEDEADIVDIGYWEGDHYVRADEEEPE